MDKRRRSSLDSRRKRRKLRETDRNDRPSTSAATPDEHQELSDAQEPSTSKGGCCDSQESDLGDPDEPSASKGGCDSQESDLSDPDEPPPLTRKRRGLPANPDTPATTTGAPSVSRYISTLHLLYCV